LSLIADGKSNAATAELRLSEHTVKRHVANILLKLDRRGRARRFRQRHDGQTGHDGHGARAKRSGKQALSILPQATMKSRRRWRWP
jgi:hypothetical protein